MRALLALTAAWSLTFAGALAQIRSPYQGTLDQHPAIDYRGGALGDPVTVLRNEVAAGTTTLAFDGRRGWLASVLEKLNVPVESQILLFSKTGIQHPFTSPENPRALYFNDRVIVGYIPGAPVIEMASHDPRQGVIFQTLMQAATPAYQFGRPDRCLSCHLSANSMEVPGILVRSMSTAADGRAMPQNGSFIINHRSRLEQRWAGWYVSGAAASVEHLGRTIAPGLDLSAYPLPTSDIAALMVFDHQGHAINLLTRLGWQARAAAADGALDFSKGELPDLVRETADYLAFAGEAALAAPVQGVSAFTKAFGGSGRRDRKGRSLRELDLQTRLFKYRCSYMIYSPAFDALPADAKAAVLARLREVITDRATIEILDDTKAGWRK